MATSSRDQLLYALRRVLRPIVRVLIRAGIRFDEFAERVGISDPVAAARLRELVQEGLLEREAYREPGQRTRQSYRLTAKGAELFPALAALQQWGDHWLNTNSGVELRHRGCGKPVGVQLRCADDHLVGADELELATQGSLATT